MNEFIDGPPKKHGAYLAKTNRGKQVWGTYDGGDRLHCDDRTGLFPGILIRAIASHAPLAPEPEWLGPERLKEFTDKVIYAKGVDNCWMGRLDSVDDEYAYIGSDAVNLTIIRRFCPITLPSDHPEPAEEPERTNRFYNRQAERIAAEPEITKMKVQTENRDSITVRDFFIEQNDYWRCACGRRMTTLLFIDEFVENRQETEIRVLWCPGCGTTHLHYSNPAFGGDSRYIVNPELKGRT
jgi:hypothetical protein